MKSAICLFILVLSVGAARAQSFDYGDLEQLRGRTHFWVDTRGDSDLKLRIVERIRKALPHFALVNSFSEAEILISFRGKTSETYGGYDVGSDSVDLSSGQGTVSVPGSSSNSRPIVVLDYKNSQDNRMEKQPWKKFVDKFVEAYKKVNGKR